TLHAGMYNIEKLKCDLEKPENYFYFIAINKALKGYFCVITKAHKLVLDKIYIHPELQGKGFGKYILNEIKKLAVEYNYNEIELRVNRKNESAINFYKKNGFSITASADFPAENGFVYDDFI